MSLLWNLQTILAKPEASYGVAETLAAADAVEAEITGFQPLAGPTTQKNIQRPYLGRTASIKTGTFVVLRFNVCLAGSGVATTIPAWMPLLQGCGFAPGAVGATEVTQGLISSFTGAGTSLTISYHHDGQQHQMVGARGNARFILNAGEIPTIEFEFTGLYVSPQSIADPAVDFSAYQTPMAVNADNTPSISLHAESLVCTTLEIDLGNTVTYRNVVGNEEVKLSGRDTTGNVVFDAPAISEKDWFTTSQNSVQGAFQSIHGIGAGNLIQLDSATVDVDLAGDQYNELEGGVSGLSGSLGFIPTSAGNDELSIQTS